jgi:PAS domain S-box-containing protein
VTTGVRRAVLIYIALLGAVLLAVLVGSLIAGKGLDERVGDWLFLIGLIAVLELADLLFHHEADREGLSSTEAVLVPLLVGFTFTQTVWGVAIAIGFASVADRRVTPIKAVFNVANLGCSAALAAWIWHLLRSDDAAFGPRNVAVAIVATLVFSVLTHVLVSVVISLAGRKKLNLWGDGIVDALGWNLVGNLSLGTFLAAAYLYSRWMILLFPLPLAFLYFGYRAVLAQTAERLRVEELLKASRALAASPSLDEALADFLQSVREVASTAEARAIVDTHRSLVWSGVRADRVVADMVPLDESPMMRDVLTEVERVQGPVIVTADEQGPLRTLTQALGVTDLMAIPLMDADAVVGCLVVLDRLGADQFGRSEARLLQALGHELVLTLDSYRLFAEVSEERERFRRIFTASKEGILLLDDRMCVRAWNPALARISGYESIEVIGRPWSERVVVRDRGSRRVEGQMLLDTPVGEELELVSRDGPSRWVSVLSSPVQGAQDRYWVVIVRDVTAEHLVEEAKSDFLSTVSHELRTPLTAIKGSLQILQRGPDKLDEKIYERMVSVMTRGTARLERLVMNLLFVSQVDADGAPRIILEELDSIPMVKERASAMAGDHPIRFELEEVDEIAVLADRERLAQIVEHLVENAAKFDPDGEIVVRLVREAGFAKLSVIDQGPGIARADQERVFERFVRLGDVLTRQTQGPGVGLFIVKTSAEAMGGQAWVESSSGHGSAFHVTFPLAKPMAVGSEAPAS